RNLALLPPPPPAFEFGAAYGPRDRSAGSTPCSQRHPPAARHPSRSPSDCPGFGEATLNTPFRNVASVTIQSKTSEVLSTAYCNVTVALRRVSRGSGPLGSRGSHRAAKEDHDG